jgi:hypothetical protein
MKASDQVLKLKGQWGRGNQAIGEVFCLEKGTIFDLQPKHQGLILAIREVLTRALWHKAKSLGLKAIICGGLPDKEFEQAIKKEVLKIGEERRNLTLPLVVLGKKGQIEKKEWEILKKNKGKKVVIEGDEKRVLIPQ